MSQLLSPRFSEGFVQGLLLPQVCGRHVEVSGCTVVPGAKAQEALLKAYRTGVAPSSSLGWMTGSGGAAAAPLTLGGQRGKGDERWARVLTPHTHTHRQINTADFHVEIYKAQVYL